MHQPRLCACYLFDEAGVQERDSDERVLNRGRAVPARRVAHQDFRSQQRTHLVADIIDTALRPCGNHPDSWMVVGRVVAVTVGVPISGLS